MFIISYNHNDIYSTYTYSYADNDNGIVFSVTCNPRISAVGMSMSMSMGMSENLYP